MGTVKMKGDVPICDMCGSLMTGFDGWAWHTCPECGNSVRIIDGEVKWEREILVDKRRRMVEGLVNTVASHLPEESILQRGKTETIQMAM